MKVIVKYTIIDDNNLSYGMFEENGKMIPDSRITEDQVPLGGIASNVGWLKQDAHRCTEKIKEHFLYVGDIEYVFKETSNWYLPKTIEYHESNLLKIAQTDADPSVSYNQYNNVVCSHNTGEQYISISDAIKYFEKEQTTNRHE